MAMSQTILGVVLLLLLRLIDSTQAETTIATLAGSGLNFANGIGDAAAFKNPYACDWFDAEQTQLLIADYSSYTIRHLDIASTEVTTWAGSDASYGREEVEGRNDFAVEGLLSAPNDVKVLLRRDMNDGSKPVIVYVAQKDASYGGIRRLSFTPNSVTTHKVITIDVSELGTQGAYQNTYALAIDSFNNCVYAVLLNPSLDSWMFVRIVNPETASPTAELIAEVPKAAVADGSIPDEARINDLRYLTIDRLQATTTTHPDLLFTDKHCIRRLTVDGPQLSITTVAGVCTATGTTNEVGTSARFNELQTIDFILTSATTAIIYVADEFNSVIRSVVYDTSAAPTYTVSVAAGVVTSSGPTNGSPGSFGWPRGLVAAPTTGDLYVTDFYSAYRKIRRVTGLQIITYTPVEPTGPTGSISGDPQFIGLHGQRYQVHGIPGEVFALVSSPHLQLNSLFTYIDDTYSRTRCDSRVYTCYVHPGTYLTNTGMSIWPRGQSQATYVTIMLEMTNNTEWEMKMSVGTDADTEDDAQQHIDTRTSATYSISNGQLLGADNNTLDDAKHNYIHIIDTHRITVHVCAHMRITVTLSPDGFLDVALSLLHRDVLSAGAHRTRVLGAHDHSIPPAYPTYPLHGLIGQTWRNAVYVTPYKGEHYYEGIIDDYIIQDGMLHGAEFAYNQFSGAK